MTPRKKTRAIPESLAKAMERYGRAMWALAAVRDRCADPELYAFRETRDIMDSAIKKWSTKPAKKARKR